MRHPEYPIRFSLIPFYHINYRLSIPFIKFLKKYATDCNRHTPPLRDTFSLYLQQFVTDTYPLTLQQFHIGTYPLMHKCEKVRHRFRPTLTENLAKWQKMVVIMVKSGKISLYRYKPK